MLSALLVALALAVAAACAALAYREASRAGRAAGEGARALAAALRALPEGERLDALARRAAPGTWEHRLAAALRDAEGPDDRVAVANDLLAEAAHGLALGAALPPAALRISALAGGLLGCVAFLAGAGVPVIAAILAAGAVGAIASAAAGRAGRAAAARRREAIDALVDALLGPRPAAVAGSAAPRRARRGRP